MNTMLSRSCCSRSLPHKLLKVGSAIMNRGVVGVGVRQRAGRNKSPVCGVAWFSGGGGGSSDDKNTKASAATASITSVNVEEEPDKFVGGLTIDKIQSNPEIAKFLDANFGGGDKDEDGNDIVDKDGYIIPPEVLEEFGIEVEEYVDPTTREYDQIKPDRGYGLTEEQQRLNIRVIRTHLRDDQNEEGTNRCKRLRYNRLIPGLLHGGNPDLGISHSDPNSKLMIKTPWSELQRELGRYHRAFESRVYDLMVYEDGADVITDDTAEPIATHRVIPTGVQRHPVQGKIYCTNFVRYHSGRPIKIPIEYVNQEESPALKRNGFIVPVNKYVECLVEDGVPIPKTLELECTGIQLKDVIRLDRITFPDGVRPSDRVDVDRFIIGPVQGGGRGSAMEGDDEDGTDAAGDAAEATA